MQIPPVDTPELMDDPSCPPDELAADLRDLARMNRVLGSHGFVRRFLDAAVRARNGQGPRAGAALQVLDVATGGADIPAAVSAWARARGLRVRVAGVDRHPAAVRIAAGWARGDPAVSLIRADASALPFRPKSLDVCLCSLALHHFHPAARAAFLRQLDRLARVGFLVVDLLRSPAAYAGVWCLTRLSRNRLMRHDGPVSVRRAMSWPEYRNCVAEAAVPGLGLEPLPFFRVALTKLGTP
jgi:SAM-dependent methyltransferase